MLKNHWTLLDRYILKKFIATFLFALLILAIVACVIDYAEKIDNLVKNNASLKSVVIYFLNFIPHIEALLFPLFVFIATIFFTSKMAYKTEIIAVLSAGVSFSRFLRSYWVGGILLGLVSLIANHIIVPHANKSVHDFQNTYIWPTQNVAVANIHLRLSPNHYVYFERFNYEKKEGDRFTSEAIDGVILEEKVMALKASYDTAKAEWHLQDVVIRKNDGIRETIEEHKELYKKYAFDPSDLEVNNSMKETMTTKQLLKFINREKERGRDMLNYYYVELHRRTAQPVAALILTIIGACIASVKVRGGSGVHLAIGIAGCAIYMLFLQFTQTFSTNAGLHPLLAMWIPNFALAIVAIYLYARQVR